MKKALHTLRIVGFTICAVIGIGLIGGIIQSCSEPKLTKQEKITALLEESKKNTEFFKQRLKNNIESIKKDEEAIDSIAGVIYTSKNPSLREHSYELLKPFAESISQSKDAIFRIQKKLYEYEYVEKHYGDKRVRSDGNFEIELKDSLWAKNTLPIDSIHINLTAKLQKQINDLKRENKKLKEYLE